MQGFVITFYLLLQWTYTAYCVQVYDMCATFQLQTAGKSIELVTPGYIENKTYPSGARCQCTLESTNSIGLSNSLNLTVLDLQLEGCPEFKHDRYDELVVTSVYRFQILRQEFVLCNNILPLSKFLNFRSRAGVYGSKNTIYSLDYLNLLFQTDNGIERRGVHLLIESFDGISVRCHGVSGPLPTTLPTTTTSPPPPTTRNYRRRTTPTEGLSTGAIGGIVGTVILLFAIGMAVMVFLLIRKYRPKDRSYNKEKRRSSEGHPIYRDPNEGHPDLPMPGSVRNQCDDQYLFMKEGATTPIYANPDPNGFYMNHEVGQNGRKCQEEQHQDGYIIPGSIMDSGSDVELPPKLKGLVMTTPKPPIAQPKSSKPQPPAKIPNRQAAADSPATSSKHSLASLDGSTAASAAGGSNHSIVSAKSSNNDLVYEPALLKPSEMKNKGKLAAGKPLPPPKVHFANSPTPAKKPQVQLKPHPPPKKPGKVVLGGDTFEVVGVKTSLDA